MSKYLDFFDDVYYINLDSRIDRREKFESQSKMLGIPSNRFSAITPKEGEYQVHETYDNENDRITHKFKVGCGLSHKAIVRLAKERNLENVLIFEDDCIFLDSYKDDIVTYVNELKTLKEWDLFYIGGSPANECKRINNTKHLYRTEGMYGAHAYALNRSFYDVILKSFNPINDIIDTFYINYDSGKKIHFG